MKRRGHDDVALFISTGNKVFSVLLETVDFSKLPSELELFTSRVERRRTGKNAVEIQNLIFYLQNNMKHFYGSSLLEALVMTGQFGLLGLLYVEQTALQMCVSVMKNMQVLERIIVANIAASKINSKVDSKFESKVGDSASEYEYSDSASEYEYSDYEPGKKERVNQLNTDKDSFELEDGADLTPYWFEVDFSRFQCDAAVMRAILFSNHILRNLINAMQNDFASKTPSTPSLDAAFGSEYNPEDIQMCLKNSKTMNPKKHIYKLNVLISWTKNLYSPATISFQIIIPPKTLCKCVGRKNHSTH